MTKFYEMMAEAANLRAQRLSKEKRYWEAQREYNEQATWLKLAHKKEVSE